MSNKAIETKLCVLSFTRRSDVCAWSKVTFVLLHLKKKKKGCHCACSFLWVSMCCRPASDDVRLRPSITVFAAADWRLLEKGQASASNVICTFKQLLTVQTKALVQRHGWKEGSGGCQLRLVNMKYRLADADKHMGRSLRSCSLRKYSRAAMKKKICP